MPHIEVLKHRKATQSGGFNYGRDDRIRTCGLLLPKQALHQTELHLVILNA